jgi:hypothetical protein
MPASGTIIASCLAQILVESLADERVAENQS